MEKSTNPMLVHPSSAYALYLSGSDAARNLAVAKTIAKGFGEAVVLSAANYKSEHHEFFYMDCNEDTEVVIITDCGANLVAEFFLVDLVRGCIVHKQGKHPFVIMPKLIFCGSVPEVINNLGDSVKFRFQLIEVEQFEQYLQRLKIEAGRSGEDFSYDVKSEYLKTILFDNGQELNMAELFNSLTEQESMKQAPTCRD